jgi:glycosyltransferase involved in cell wall biosynthesis
MDSLNPIPNKTGFAKDGDNRKKILYFVTRGDSIGGAQIHVRDMAIAAKEEFTPFVCTGQRGVLNDALEEKGVKTFSIGEIRRSINLIKDIRGFFAFLQLLREVKPDLVSLHSSKAGFIGRIACFVEGVPCLFTAHGWSFTVGVSPLKRFLYWFIEWVTAWMPKKIICVSQFDLDLAKKLQLPEKRLKLIYNAVHDPGVKKGFDSKALLKVVMIGRFDDQKDQKTLVKACASIEKVRLTFIGDGKNKKNIIRLVENLNLGDRVSFIEKPIRAAEELKNFDVFALSSNWEGFPRSILEAMASGLPIIASDVGGASEAFVNGREGYTVPKGDIEAWKSTLQRFIETTGLVERMGRAARDAYEERFTFHRLKKETFAVYREILR